MQHACLTGEPQGYYLDFGSLQDVANAYRDGFVYDEPKKSAKKKG